MSFLVQKLKTRKIYCTIALLATLTLLFNLAIHTDFEYHGKNSKRGLKTKLSDFNSFENYSSEDGRRSSTSPQIQQIETELQSKQNVTSGLGIKLQPNSAGTETSIVRKHVLKPINKTRLPDDVEEKIVQCGCRPLHVDPVSNISQAALSSLDPRWGMSSEDSLYRHHPNLPMMLLTDSNPRCSLMPNTFSIEWKNVHWQGYSDALVKTGLLYSAFFDNRPGRDPPGGAVRMLALMKLQQGEKLPWCHLWYAGQTQPVPSRVIRMDYMDYQNRTRAVLNPYTLVCPVKYLDDESRKNSIVPIAVSLVPAPCVRATNVLKVVGRPFQEASHFKHTKQAPNQLPDSNNEFEVAVCGPALYYAQEDFSIRIVEWLELLKTLKVSKVFLYQTEGLHPNISKVFRHYEQEGYVELVNFHYPPPYMDEPLLRRMWNIVHSRYMFAMENIYFTDCVLRYKDRYRFLAHFDPDEIPVLLQHNSLPELMAYLTSRLTKGSKPTPGYKLAWSFFPLFPPSVNSGVSFEDKFTKQTAPSIDDDEESHSQPSEQGLLQYLTILRNNRRLTVDDIKQHRNWKTIYDTHYVTAVYSHSTFICTWGDCRKAASQLVPKDVAMTGHFRNACDDKCKLSNYTTEVPEVVKHLTDVLPKIERVLKHLDLIPS